MRTKGKIVDDFDLLIGATAIFNNLILVTKNVKHFDWRLDAGGDFYHQTSIEAETVN